MCLEALFSQIFLAGEGATWDSRLYQLLQQKSIKPPCSHFSFVIVDKSLEPSSAHIPADNATDVLSSKVKLEGLTSLTPQV